jgi:hypothetical protein
LFRIYFHRSQQGSRLSYKQFAKLNTTIERPDEVAVRELRQKINRNHTLTGEERNRKIRPRAIIVHVLTIRSARAKREPTRRIKSREVQDVR